MRTGEPSVVAIEQMSVLWAQLHPILKVNREGVCERERFERYQKLSNLFIKNNCFMEKSDI